jgi:hypothetical protein
MPHTTGSVEVTSRRRETPASGCVHEFVRIEKWSESTTTEDRVTDDFGRKSGPMHHRRMTTMYEKYRCRLCGEEDTQSYTVWADLRR